MRQKRRRKEPDLWATGDALKGFQQVESLSTKPVDKLLTIVLMKHKSNILTSDFYLMHKF